MRLVENEHVGVGQNFAEAVLLQRQVGEVQVMIYHQDIGVHGFFTRLENEAAVELGAFAAETIVSIRGGVVPQAVIFRNTGKLADIAAIGLLGPAGKRAEDGGHFAALEAILGAVSF